LRLRPVSELPDIYRSVFKFGVFNAIQSTCFDAVLHSHENLVGSQSFVSASSSVVTPTGSGKTVLFELGIVRMLTEAAQRSQSVKCVYVSPTKALCTEKYKEWTAKFAGLGIKTCELTGDTVLFGNGAWGDAKNAQVIQAEKWDSLTRHWADHTGVLSQIQLFLVDEVHILNESRGSTLEVVVSRMKSRGSAVRFILVSATVPNIEDVASWIGSVASDHRPARVFQFGEEYRPCKLTRFVYGVPKPKGQNDFAYAHALDNRLFSVLQQHSANKPILVFCPTRKGTLTTAKHLAQEYEHAMKSKQHVPWSPPPQVFRTKILQAFLAAVGIGVHHAGLNLSDKKLVEELFMKKTISVLLATSTLAVGVNLPAHMVVIKGVKIYQSGETKEYSDLDMMQMMGRAGRPQFDTDGIAIILCENELESKYRALTQGTTTLESSLHTNLIEHLNSEIGLGTIADLESAKGWLRQSFLYRRIQKNPDHYEIGKDADETWQDKVDEIVMQSVDKLQQTQLIDYSEASGSLGCTEYGDIMSKFYLRRSTMHAIMELPPTATMREITYDKIRRNADIRFPVKKIQGTNDKIFLLVQAVLGGLPLGSAEFKTADSQPSLEAFSVFRHIARIATAVVEVAIIKKNGAQTKNGLALVRSLYAKAWDDRPIVLRQVEHIGEKSSNAPPFYLKPILAEHNITTFDQLLKQDTFRIETLLGRRSPFGFEILTSAREFPRYFLNIVEVGVRPSDGKDPVEVELTIECGTADDGNPKLRTTKQKQKGRGMDMTTVLTVTSDLLFIDFRRIATKALKEKKTFSICAQLTKPSQTISVIIASERDLEGLEDCPDFWDMNVDDECDENVPIKDLTESRAMSSNRSAVGMSSKSPVNQAQDQCEPKKRSDGKYDCNHPCKDKSTCRHLCCRDGLPEPPRGPKKRLENPEPIASVTKRLPESKPIQVVLLDDVPNVKKQKRLKSDPVLRQLDDLHRGAGVDRNIKLPEGRRLKMDDSGPSKGQRKPAPNFDLELTTLRCSVSPAAKIHSGIASDDDEMLTISELLDVGKTARSESNYSNSEVDALIRNLPLGGGDDEVEIIDAPPFAALPPMPVTLPRKRARSPVPPKSFCPFDDGNNDQPQPKRIKSTTKDSNRQFGSPSGSLKEKVGDRCTIHRLLRVVILEHGTRFAECESEALRPFVSLQPWRKRCGHVTRPQSECSPPTGVRAYKSRRILLGRKLF
ncbi:P-loop containing nucleoside triphosphate hydrolase protein, partial [Leucogyrophana mollusca]